MIVWMREESRGGEEGWTHVLEVKSTGFADGLNAGGTGKKKTQGHLSRVWLKDLSEMGTCERTGFRIDGNQEFYFGYVQWGKSLNSLFWSFVI